MVGQPNYPVFTLLVFVQKTVMDFEGKGKVPAIRETHLSATCDRAKRGLCGSSTTFILLDRPSNSETIVVMEQIDNHFPFGIEQYRPVDIEGLVRPVGKTGNS